MVWHQLNYIWILFIVEGKNNSLNWGKSTRKALENPPAHLSTHLVTRHCWKLRIDRILSFIFTFLKARIIFVLIWELPTTTSPHKSHCFIFIWKSNMQLKIKNEVQSTCVSPFHSFHYSAGNNIGDLNFVVSIYLCYSYKMIARIAVSQLEEDTSYIHK